MRHKEKERREKQKGDEQEKERESPVRIPYGILKIDLSLIPPIRSKQRVTTDRILTPPFFIHTNQSFTLLAHCGSDMNTSRIPIAFDSGPVFVPVMPFTQTRFSVVLAKAVAKAVAKDTRSEIEVYDRCLTDSFRATTINHPYMQFGDTGFFFYHGTLTHTPQVWEDQIRHVLHDFSFTVRGPPIWSTRFFHTRGDEISQCSELRALCAGVESFYLEEEKEQIEQIKEKLVCLQYKSSNRDAIHRVLKARYDVSFLDCTYDVVRRWMTFDQAVAHMRAEVQARSKLPPYAQFYVLGETEVVEEEYTRMIQNRA